MRLRHFLIFSSFLAGGTAAFADHHGAVWHSLFDGKSLAGWRASENPRTFKVIDGVIVAHGRRAHLFYEGPVSDHTFTNFEFEAEVMTKPGANSGVYFHTAWQDDGWPDQGYEAQVNNSQSDWRRTGSLYGIDDVREVLPSDNEWFTLNVTVRGRRVIIKVNDQITVDYVEPVNVVEERNGAQPRRKLGSGTFALQGHDPDSEVHYRKLRVRLLE